ncbi:hypothetical protein DQW50_12850 [Halorubrum sp. 48-1-W]|uniref:hypothetical protein n=1 Tax=Halorubrum sp. 48-1-W TaxID=2249761 RepID=UPI000DCB2A28|nr:hypothetical protein [Halorubrum sp. 48-1-W]RAW44732.1 hypothetical protein DQW50_12850 [Halorubrum sp. 48-1-W]
MAHSGVIYVRQAGRRIGDVVKVVDERLQNRSEDAPPRICDVHSTVRSEIEARQRGFRTR